MTENEALALGFNRIEFFNSCEHSSGVRWLTKSINTAVTADVKHRLPSSS